MLHEVVSQRIYGRLFTHHLAQLLLLAENTLASIEGFLAGLLLTTLIRDVPGMQIPVRTLCPQPVLSPH